MGVFITGNELNSELSRIIENAEEQLIIISPFIKLHERYKSIFRTKIEKPNLSIIIVFGKNEKELSKSLNREDFEFFKQFPNIEIKYEKRLHAKLYANQDNILISSMNLYDYSQDTNIETGIIDLVNNEIGEEALNYFRRVIEQADMIFEKIPYFEKKMLGFSEKYIESKVKVDNSLEFYSNKNYSKRTIKNTSKTTIKNVEKFGYCIRTGKKISFDVNMPMSSQAYKSWNKYKDENYPEKFCHFSGEKSNGETSFKKPILKNNWKLAKNKFNL